MDEKYQGKYRIRTARAEWWDYAHEAAYFITICTQNRNQFFGKIGNQKMTLSAIGQIVDEEWRRSFALRTDMNLIMDEYVIMPNHFHAIVIIEENSYNTCCKDMKYRDSGLDPLINQRYNRFGPQSKSLSAVVRGFKGVVTSRAREINPLFGWQTRYHDHIIRDDFEHARIAYYIATNVENWHSDTFYQDPA
jgi:REP element-mobilizing transposase RayT